MMVIMMMMMLVLLMSSYYGGTRLLHRERPVSSSHQHETLYHGDHQYRLQLRVLDRFWQCWVLMMRVVMPPIIRISSVLTNRFLIQTGLEANNCRAESNMGRSWSGGSRANRHPQSLAALIDKNFLVSLLKTLPLVPIISTRRRWVLTNLSPIPVVLIRRPIF